MAEFAIAAAKAAGAYLVKVTGATGAAAVAIKAGVYVAFAAGYFAGLNALAQALSEDPENDAATATTREPAGPRVIHFGQVLTGARGVYDSASSNSEIRWQVWYAGEGPVVQVLSHRFDGAEHSFSANPTEDGNLGADFNRRVTVDFRSGTVDQTASPLMLETYRDFRAAGWTGDHRGAGLVYYALRTRRGAKEDFSKWFPRGGPPVPRLEGRFQTPYDPRDGQSRWSDNGALVLGWYLTSVWGFGLPDEAIDWDSFAAAADVCDQMGLRLSGSFLSSEPRGDVLAKLESAIDARLTLGGDGRVNLKVGWETPVLHFGPGDINSVERLAGREGGPDSVTSVIVAFKDRTQNYEIVETDPVSAGDLDARDPQRVRLSFVPLRAQAEYLARRRLSQAQAAWRVTLETRLIGLEALAHRFVTLTLPDIGLDRAEMEVTGVRFDTGGLVVALDLVSVSPADFDINI